MNPDIEVSLPKPFQTYGSFSIAFQCNGFPDKIFLPIGAMLKPMTEI